MSIDSYGGGVVGSPAAANLASHIRLLRGFNSGGTADFVAQNITLDNSANATALPGQNETLEFDATTIL